MAILATAHSPLNMSTLQTRMCTARVWHHHTRSCEEYVATSFCCTHPTEYCSRGSLYDVLRQACRDREAAGQLTWQRRLSMLFDAARGLLYLHARSPPIIHHDVKSPNLLVDRCVAAEDCIQ